jgi:hypothetical protein
MTDRPERSSSAPRAVTALARVSLSVRIVAPLRPVAIGVHRHHCANIELSLRSSTARVTGDAHAIAWLENEVPMYIGGGALVLILLIIIIVLLLRR